MKTKYRGFFRIKFKYASLKPNDQANNKFKKCAPATAL